MSLKRHGPGVDLRVSLANNLERFEVLSTISGVRFHAWSFLFGVYTAGGPIESAKLSVFDPDRSHRGPVVRPESRRVVLS